MGPQNSLNGDDLVRLSDLLHRVEAASRGDFEAPRLHHKKPRVSLRFFLALFGLTPCWLLPSCGGRKSQANPLGLAVGMWTTRHGVLASGPTNPRDLTATNGDRRWLSMRIDRNVTSGRSGGPGSQLTPTPCRLTPCATGNEAVLSGDVTGISVATIHR